LFHVELELYTNFKVQVNGRTDMTKGVVVVDRGVVEHRSGKYFLSRNADTAAFRQISSYY